MQNIFSYHLVNSVANEATKHQAAFVQETRSVSSTDGINWKVKDLLSWGKTG